MSRWHDMFASRVKANELQSNVRAFLTRKISHGLVADEARHEPRAKVVEVVLVVPFTDDSPLLDDAFGAITVDFCTTGLALITDHEIQHDSVVIVLKDASKHLLLRGTVRSREELTFGFRRVGIELSDTVALNEIPNLSAVV